MEKASTTSQGRLKILVSDYGGYPYPIQLSRWLARQGHQVLHIYNDKEPPRGILARDEKDPASLEIQGINIYGEFGKEDFLKRRNFEVRFGKALAQKATSFQPDVIISANAPVETQFFLVMTARKHRTRFIYWIQDLRGLAAFGILHRKIPGIGFIIGLYYLWLERLQMYWSDQIILITEAFQPFVSKWVRDERLIHVIPNWAPLEELPIVSEKNSWAEEHKLEHTFNILFAGVLGMKHNPDLLLKLALHFQDNEDIRIVVVSRGPGTDWLLTQKQSYSLNNLVLIDFQPFELMPQIIASSNILISILEPEAGIYSVPSKVQTYLCGKKPLLLSVPADNLIARIVKEVNAGIIVPPNDINAFISAAEILVNDPELCQKYGRNARAYAEETFNIDKIGRKFDKIISSNI